MGKPRRGRPIFCPSPQFFPFLPRPAGDPSGRYRGNPAVANGSRTGHSIGRVWRGRESGGGGEPRALENEHGSGCAPTCDVRAPIHVFSALPARARLKRFVQGPAHLDERFLCVTASIKGKVSDVAGGRGCHRERESSSSSSRGGSSARARAATTRAAMVAPSAPLDASAACARVAPSKAAKRRKRERARGGRRRTRGGEFCAHARRPPIAARSRPMQTAGNGRAGELDVGGPVRRGMGRIGAGAATRAGAGECGDEGERRSGHSLVVRRRVMRRGIVVRKTMCLLPQRR